MQRYSPANPLLPKGFIPPSEGVKYGDARLGDSKDRRQTFGNLRAQPFWPRPVARVLRQDPRLLEELNGGLVG